MATALDVLALGLLPVAEIMAIAATTRSTSIGLNVHAKRGQSMEERRG